MSGTRAEVPRSISERLRDRPVVRDRAVTSSHGAGGKAQAALLEGLLFESYGSDELRREEDGAVLHTAGAERLVFTTDSFVVTPREFPGGSLGRLAVFGTVNDLAVMGADPRWISVALILEEGFAMDELRKVADDIAAAASEAGVAIVTGDTKVVERGRGDGVYVNTAGIGFLPEGLDLGAHRVVPGDRVVVSGNIGDHGTAVLLARGELAFAGDVRSDCGTVTELTRALLEAAPGTRWMRDPTRGGLASVCAELAAGSGAGIVLNETALPIRPTVRAACELLGIDPLYVANEGKVVAVVPEDEADSAVEALRRLEGGGAAAVVGTVAEDSAGVVLLETAVGGKRVVDQLVGDPLPRIC
ncbi:MAG: hydrogenase expression/formation protein HypE [Actinobacteria bacterium ATB1]|nr:hydrogenase expression/formation protein HypE [Actinobacteria bacterium ATB1]